MINIIYFSNSRLEFFELMFYFLTKIKPENKEKITLYILTTNTNINFFEIFNNQKHGITLKIVPFSDGFNYTEKLKFSINLDCEYSIKLDEDCFINNHIWDYLIENCAVLNNDENLLISPILSTSLPSCDEFIDNFLNDYDRKTIHNHLLNQKMPNGLFNVNYEPLNKFTIEANTWEPKSYYNAIANLPTEKKGIHPIRISYNAQIDLNQMILKNYKKLLTKNIYNFFEINVPYFTINMFMIKTSTWKHICDKNSLEYDEIPISNYKRSNNLKFLFIKNAYGVHTMYNTIYGNTNKWGIGGVDSIEQENNFVNNLKKLIL